MQRVINQKVNRQIDLQIRKNKQEIRKNNKKQQMLHVSLSPSHTHKFIESCPKQNEYFVVGIKDVKLVQEVINETFFRTFQGSKSLTIILLRKLLLELINKKLDVPLVEEVLELLKQYELQIKQYKLHYFELQKLLFEQQSINLQNQSPKHDLCDPNHKDFSIAVNPPSQSPEHSIHLHPDQRNSRSLVYDIESYSEDSKHNFFSSFDDKYFCSEYLTTSEDQKQHTTRSTIIQQLKLQLQNKLKIQPHVSAFSFTLNPKPIGFDFDQELLQWKRSKNSIMQEHSLQKAISPHDHEDRDFIKLMKYQHYRQKIKSTIVKKRLSSKHSPS